MIIKIVKPKNKKIIVVEAGVKSILNFLPINLSVPDHIAVQNIDLYAKLQELNYWKEQLIKND